MNFYLMMNLVLIFFAKSFGLTFCEKLKHQHVVSKLENVSKTHSQIYDFYHFQMVITDCFNCIFEFMHLFLAVDQNSKNSQILLSCLILKDFKINICNSTDA